MSIEIILMVPCKACGHTSRASEEDHGRGRLTFGVCDRCRALGPMFADGDDDPAPTTCECGGTRTEWDHQTCPRCGAAAKPEWSQAYN